MPSRLTPDQIQHFEREGYLLYQQDVLQPARFTALKEHFEALLAGWTAGGESRPEHMDMPHMSDPTLFTWLLDDDVLDVVESVIGPDIALWSSHFISKPPGDGMRVGWHEDSFYWNKSISPMEVVTVWLAIDPSSAANGCMRVIPGTHNNGYSQYRSVDQRAVFTSEIQPDQFDESKAVDCVLGANQCSLHHAKLIHGSNANSSASRRCGYTMRYFSTACKFIGSNQSGGHEVFLARGRDLAGNKYGDPKNPGKAWQGPRFDAARA
jgi:hypothetical protein